jgi:hypothetical protein
MDVSSEQSITWAQGGIYINDSEKTKRAPCVALHMKKMVYLRGTRYKRNNTKKQKNK